MVINYFDNHLILGPKSKIIMYSPKYTNILSEKYIFFKKSPLYHKQNIL